MNFTLKAKEEGIRIDKYLSDLFTFSRSTISENIKNSNIKVNGQGVKASYKINIGDIIEGFIEEKEISLKPHKMNLDIIYEDEYIIALNKPYNLVVHPSLSTTEATLVNGLLAYTERLSDIGGPARPGIVHRLDKDTTGILLVAKDNLSHERLSQLFKERKIKKTYLALVHGRILEKGRVDLPIGRDQNNRTKMSVDFDHGKEALSLYQPLATSEDYSLIKIRLITGRTHQIRVHMSHINHFIIGDRLYGRKENLTTKHHMLHAYKLEFFHPITAEPLSLCAPIDDEFQETMNKIGIKYAINQEKSL